MFYAKDSSGALRFGDVLMGFPLSTPSIKGPILNADGQKCDVNVDFTQFSVIMDPCCNIGKKTVSMTPLIEVWDFFDNPYLREDLTRLNRPMEPQQTLPPNSWRNLPPEEKEKRLRIGRGYAFLNLFVYEGNDLFPEQNINNTRGEDIKTRYRMIDFRNTYKLDCAKIVSPTNAPLEAKMLELSIETRTELRNKVAFYYGRAPDEDLP